MEYDAYDNAKSASESFMEFVGFRLIVGGPLSNSDANNALYAREKEERREMSDLLVILCDDELKAEEVRLDLLKRRDEHLVDLDDAVFLVISKEGKVRLHLITDLTLEGAVYRGFVGALFGVLNPVAFVLGLTVRYITPNNARSLSMGMHAFRTRGKVVER